MEQYRLYVVFEQAKKVKTREIFISHIHLANIDIREQECLDLLKADLNLEKSDTVHGAVYIGPSPKPVTLKYLYSEDLYAIYIESLRRHCENDLKNAIAGLQKTAMSDMPLRTDEWNARIKRSIEEGEPRVFKLEGGQELRLLMSNVEYLGSDVVVPALNLAVMDRTASGVPFLIEDVCFPVSMFDKVLRLFDDIAGSANPDNTALDKGFTDHELLLLHKGDIHHGSHYDYLDVMLNPFWVKVFNKTADEMWFGGAVSAHGDKCYGYKNKWAKADINSYRGALLYLLTYTKVMDRPKHESSEWVIENYSRYLPMIEAAEREVMAELHKKTLAP